MTTRTLAPALRAAALAACACLVALPALAAPKSTIVLGATNSTSSHFAVANGMVKAIKAGIPSSNVSVIETGASVDNVRRLTKSEIDIGLIATDTGIQALTGTGPFQGRAVDDLVAVYSYDVSVLNDAGNTDISALRPRSAAHRNRQPTGTAS